METAAHPHGGFPLVLGSQAAASVTPTRSRLSPSTSPNPPAGVFPRVQAVGHIFQILRPLLFPPHIPRPPPPPAGPIPALGKVCCPWDTGPSWARLHPAQGVKQQLAVPGQLRGVGVPGRRARDGGVVGKPQRRLPRGPSCTPDPTLCLDFWPSRGPREKQVGVPAGEAWVLWLQALPRMSICLRQCYLAPSVGTSSPSLSSGPLGHQGRTSQAQGACRQLRPPRRSHRAVHYAGGAPHSLEPQPRRLSGLGSEAGEGGGQSQGSTPASWAEGGSVGCGISTPHPSLCPGWLGGKL